MRLRRFALWLLALTPFVPTFAGNRNTYPLPEERGTAGTLKVLEKLPVFVRVLETTAHPDDETAGTLAWLAREAHAQTALFAMTRGEGGQNVLGSEKYDALGLLRTGELLEACRYYGVSLYFSTAIDFGFSKSAEETLSKWGREAVLEQMVRFIRMWKPTVIISRFQGNSGDGHGHHQAAGIITHEAYRVAGDPGRFPEHFKLGLRPWLAARLYESSGRGGAGVSAASAAHVPVGDYDPVLGRSFREIGAEGYSKHRSQGNGAVYALPGQSYENFRLVDSAAGGKTPDGSFFDSMDTSLSAIAGLAREEEAFVPFLREGLARAQKLAAEALNRFQAAHPSESAEAVLEGASMISGLLRQVDASSLTDGTKRVVEDALKEKLADFHDAVNATLGIYLVAQGQDVTVVPGEKEPLTVYLYNRGTEEIDLTDVSITTLQNLKVSYPPDMRPGRIQPGGSATVRIAVEIAADAKVTEPFWYRESREDARYHTRPTGSVFAPFADPEITAHAVYRFHGEQVEISAPTRAQAGDAIRGSDFEEIQIVPPLSVAIVPDFGIAPLSSAAQTRQFRVSVLNNDKAGTHGICRLAAPAGWRVEPTEAKLELPRKAETATALFTVHIPAGTGAGTYPIEAIAASGGREYRGGYQVISYPGNWTRNLYSPSSSHLEIFDVKVAPDLTVGYVTGSGDDVPASLEQLGVKVQVVTAADLAFGDLSRFSAIVTGVRAYNVNEDLRANNRRLLRYVEQGGTLVVQYNRLLSRGAESLFPYGPYPMSDSDADRITVEDSPVRILDPQNPVFNTPNKITEVDFRDWVQERGAYFMHSWDPHYTPLLSGSDPGERPMDGGMLMVKYGKGYYIYTAYSWFRQLPAGVPGAFRIFANMLSLGRR